MKTLLLADLHLTDNFLDEYRWEIFDWVKGINEEKKLDRLLILGDLTEKKDRHSAGLVNRVVDRLTELWYGDGIEVIILKGNHDFIDSETPFFGFLHQSENIRYVSRPHENDEELFLPYSEDPDTDWKQIDFRKYKRIYMHQSVEGCIANNGMIMKEGLSLKHRLFQECTGEIYSGHIHKPQHLQPGIHCSFDYVGSPYPVYFGDTGMWRGIFLDNEKATEYVHKTLCRHMIDISDIEVLKDYEIRPGDQCKVRMKLQRSDYHLWNDYRDAVKDYIKSVGAHLVSIELLPNKISAEEFYRSDSVKTVKMTDIELIEQYSIKEKLTPDFIEIAKGLIR